MGHAACMGDATCQSFINRMTAVVACDVIVQMHALPFYVPWAVVGLLLLMAGHISSALIEVC